MSLKCDSDIAGPTQAKNCARDQRVKIYLAKRHQMVGFYVGLAHCMRREGSM